MILITKLPHFFVKCRKVNNLWKYWFNWWKILTNQDVMNQHNELEECIIMGFPETSDDIVPSTTVYYIPNIIFLYNGYLITMN